MIKSVNVRGIPRTLAGGSNPGRTPAEAAAGFRQAGSGREEKLVFFPPPYAPEAVKAAWNETTKGMTFREYTLTMAPFMSALTGANAATGSSRIFGTKAEDYYLLLDSMAEKLDGIYKKCNRTEKKKYGFQIKVIHTFRDNIMKRASK